MGRIGLLLSFARRVTEGVNVSDCKVDFGDGDTALAEYYAPPGYDPHPLPGDFVFCVPGPGGGRYYALGFVDPKIAGESAAGETLIYSRTAPGVIAAKLLLKANGSAVMTLGGLAAKVVEFTADGDVIADGISLKTHTHPYTNDIFTAPDGPSVPTPSETDPPS